MPQKPQREKKTRSSHTYIHTHTYIHKLFRTPLHGILAMYVCMHCICVCAVSLQYEENGFEEEGEQVEAQDTHYDEDDEEEGDREMEIGIDDA